MPKFTVTERVPTYMIWTYEVEANNETEALEIVIDGKAEIIDSVTENPDYSLAEYEIEDEDGEVYDVERDMDDEEYTQDDYEDGDDRGDDYDEIPWDTQTR